jgi:ADP-dependent NAD(P)H-hydrate dehydratase / NAD(P)H-hydrate epimerase
LKNSDDFIKNLALLNGQADVLEITSEADQGLFNDRHILIDAIFGSGLSREAEGLQAQAIRCMNSTKTIRIAVDMPSGLFADRHSQGTITKANVTISFQLPKLAFLLPENYSFVGEWETIDIGLSRAFLENVDVSNYYLTRKGIKKKLKARAKFDHKGDHGKALLVAGGFGKMGAAVLSTRAALRSGVGLMTVHVPKSGYTILQTAVPEAMVDVDSNEWFLTEVKATEGYAVIGIGPGIGQEAKTSEAFHLLLQLGKPMVLDADALNILAKNSSWLDKLPANSILSPHPKEFERLVGNWSNDFERLEKQKHLATRTKAVIILKGAHTSIATPAGDVFFNATGNPGMATGGSGDVLTGILTGLLAQGYSAEDSAILGVYLHGLAGDLAYQEKGLYSLIASDLVDQIPHAFRKISS